MKIPTKTVILIFEFWKKGNMNDTMGNFGKYWTKGKICMYMLKICLKEYQYKKLIFHWKHLKILCWLCVHDAPLWCFCSKNTICSLCENQWWSKNGTATFNDCRQFYHTIYVGSDFFNYTLHTGEQNFCFMIKISWNSWKYDSGSKSHFTPSSGLKPSNSVSVGLN